MEIRRENKMEIESRTFRQEPLRLWPASKLKSDVFFYHFCFGCNTSFKCFSTSGVESSKEFKKEKREIEFFRNFFPVATPIIRIFMDTAIPELAAQTLIF